MDRKTRIAAVTVGGIAVLIGTYLVHLALEFGSMTGRCPGMILITLLLVVMGFCGVVRGVSQIVSSLRKDGLDPC